MLLYVVSFLLAREGGDQGLLLFLARSCADNPLEKRIIRSAVKLAIFRTMHDRDSGGDETTFSLRFLHFFSSVIAKGGVQFSRRNPIMCSN